MNYIYSDNLSALDNMLLDSYLTNKCNESYFRLYKWIKPTISSGITNNINELNLDYIKNNNIDIIHRESGGGIVFHDNDLCFSFIGNLEKKPKDNYNYIKDVIETILLELGLNVTKTQNNNIKSSICFNGSNNHEISVNNKKVIGIAQKIVKKRYLIQGSIQLNDIKNNFILQNNLLKQNGLKNIDINILKDKLHKRFGKMAIINIDNIIHKQEYVNFKEKNKDKFLKGVNG